MPHPPGAGEAELSEKEEAREGSVHTAHLWHGSSVMFGMEQIQTFLVIKRKQYLRKIQLHSIN